MPALGNNAQRHRETNRIPARRRAARGVPKRLRDLDCHMRKLGAGSAWPGFLLFGNQFRPGHALPAPSCPRISFHFSPLSLVLPDRNAYKSRILKDERS